MTDEGIHMFSRLFATHGFSLTLASISFSSFCFLRLSFASLLFSRCVSRFLFDSTKPTSSFSFPLSDVGEKEPPLCSHWSPTSSVLKLFIAKCERLQNYEPKCSVQKHSWLLSRQMCANILQLHLDSLVVTKKIFGGNNLECIFFNHTSHVLGRSLFFFQIRAFYPTADRLEISVCIAWHLSCDVQFCTDAKAK